MDQAHRNRQLALDACSWHPGALMAASATEVEYTLMGRTHRFAPTFHGQDDVVSTLFAEFGAVLASGRMIPVNAFAEGNQVVVEFEGQGAPKAAATTTTATATSSGLATVASRTSASTSTPTSRARCSVEWDSRATASWRCDRSCRCRRWVGVSQLPRHGQRSGCRQLAGFHARALARSETADATHRVFAAELSATQRSARSQGSDGCSRAPTSTPWQGWRARRPWAATQLAGDVAAWMHPRRRGSSVPPALSAPQAQRAAAPGAR